jgi:nicotinate-nucleotide adenylyltransferase
LIATNHCAIFGGSFDPIHNGHRHLVSSLVDSGKFQKIIVVPAGDPWQKKPQASKEDRLAMTRLGLADISVEVNDCEVVRSGPSYAIDTAIHLKSHNPNSQLTWIIGSDALASLPTWNRFEELVALVDFLVVQRPGYVIDTSIVNPKIKWSSIQIHALDISATQIRRAISEGGDISGLVPTDVARYIAEKRLYGAA